MTTTTLPQAQTSRTGFGPTVLGALRAVGWFLRENWLFTLGLALLLGLYSFGAIGSLMVDPKRANMGANPLSLPPSWEHPMGTEGFGRDVFTLMLLGIPNTFKIGLVAGGVGVVIGALIGLFSGYYRGYLDTFFSSFADVMLVIPALAILITLSAYVRVMTVEIMALIVGLLAWPLPARLIRAQTLEPARAFICGCCETFRPERF
jgi:peptide/nickel transport system permease protein